MARALVLADAVAAVGVAGGVALIARGPASADAPALYRRRILGAMLVGASLFLGGFVTASWMAGT